MLLTLLQSGGAGLGVTQTSRFDNANTFHNPTLSVGAVNLDVPPVENTSVFYAATVTSTGGGQDLAPGLYTNAQTFYAPDVTQGAAPEPDNRPGGGMGVPLRFVTYNPAQPRRRRKKRQEEILFMH